MVIPIEKQDEVKSVLHTQPAKRLRSKPIVRSNDFLWVYDLVGVKILSSTHTKFSIVYL
jgi:hypothetical protein